MADLQTNDRPGTWVVEYRDSRGNPSTTCVYSGNASDAMRAANWAEGRHCATSATFLED